MGLAGSGCDMVSERSLSLGSRGWSRGYCGRKKGLFLSPIWFKKKMLLQDALLKGGMNKWGFWCKLNYFREAQGPM
jgi:hypothetical protein